MFLSLSHIGEPVATGRTGSQKRKTPLVTLLLSPAFCILRKPRFYPPCVGLSVAQGWLGTWLPRSAFLRPYTSLALVGAFQAHIGWFLLPHMPPSSAAELPRLFSLLPACYTLQYNLQAHGGPGYLRSCRLHFSAPLESLSLPSPGEPHSAGFWEW
jgi:hypothetical protein